MGKRRNSYYDEDKIRFYKKKIFYVICIDFGVTQSFPLRLLSIYCIVSWCYGLIIASCLSLQ